MWTLSTDTIAQKVEGGREGGKGLIKILFYKDGGWGGGGRTTLVIRLTQKNTQVTSKKK